MEAAIDFGPAFSALTNLILTAVESTDPRRFALVHSLSKTAQQLVRAVSVRVEDFDDTRRASSKRSFFKSLSSHAPATLVPAELPESTASVLTAMSGAIVMTVGSNRDSRFAEIERISQLALDFLESLAPPPPKTKPSIRVEAPEDINEIGCVDPEGAYINHAILEAFEEEGMPRAAAAQDNGPVDVNELRREIVEIEGIRSQMRAELVQAQIASQEAVELDHLLRVIERGGAEVTGLASDRITVLKARLRLRTKGVEGNAAVKQSPLVPSNISRGHQPRREGKGANYPQGHARHGEREEGARSAAQESPIEALGLGAMGDA